MKDPDDRLLDGYRCKIMPAEAVWLGFVLLSCKLLAPPVCLATTLYIVTTRPAVHFVY